ncbi:DUF2147 domain-containing protein [Lysobacter sp. HDW10]|jgi:hypothetical protein|uniref:DUF2147 domain-containing protein n=1 Tax=Lysobacter sp. HDW10 TaxID=2714936 RepID=UPI001408DBD0|nr:DUF2147 domain-containing protein [Lysobacter sp. HDW10]QIK81587.1 DUF2147 domain-containing protein [Lysobacter sp. HDW10]
MRTILKTALLTLALSPLAAMADTASPIGKWTTLDDESGKPMTVVEVYKAANGTLAAKVVENIAAPATCTTCKGKDKGRPIEGVVVLWNLKVQKDGTYGDGNGFKPSSGDSFRAKSVKVVEGGKKLAVTGCKAIFCRTATWVKHN